MENDSTPVLSDIVIGDIVIDNSSTDYTWHTTDTLTITDPNNYDITIQRPGQPPMKVAETLECIMDRLAILEPDFDKMEKYPALKEAYDNYKTIEALVANNNSTN